MPFCSYGNKKLLTKWQLYDIIIKMWVYTSFLKRTAAGPHDENGDSDCLKRANLWQTTMKAFF